MAFPTRLTSARLRRVHGPRLHFDGAVLTGEATTRAVEVTVPARLVSFRREEFPAAADAVLRAAVRLKAERAFAALGPVIIDGILGPAIGGKRMAGLAALPSPVLDALRAAAKARGLTVTAVRVAELLLPVPAGGLVQSGGEACLLAVDGHGLRAIAILGRTDTPVFAAQEQRERLRLGVAADAPAAAATGAALDFAHPALSATTPLFARRGARLAALGAGIAAVVALALLLAVGDAVGARDAAVAEAARRKPLADTLAARRADLKELAPWFTERASFAPGFHALATALPAADSADRVLLVRIRQQAAGGGAGSGAADGVAEGIAGDRAQLMAYLGRLRRDPRIAAAEVRSFRGVGKGSPEVAFELVFRLVAGGAHAAT